MACSVWRCCAEEGEGPEDAAAARDALELCTYQVSQQLMKAIHKVAVVAGPEAFGSWPVYASAFTMRGGVIEACASGASACHLSGAVDLLWWILLCLDVLRLRCAVLCCAVLCCAVLCCAVPCRAMPCHAMPCYAVLQPGVWCYPMLWCTTCAMLLYAVQYCTMLHCAVSRCAVPCHALS